MQVTGGLSASFARNVTTVDPTGASIAAGAGRFDRPMLMPNVNAPVKSDVFAPPISERSFLLGSGVNADGAE
ncbi:MAG: hypothetical protein JNM07_07765, partial [Phycisphaerae bacterium]|nr:hypothetical protein [Phycisphaerae bacterium]